ncbi:DUF2442 domain-containing protein [Salinarimonas sp.]|uniref:DUF2442 domain-containing protein n=1 Tax=Salinarimonas sp. TaxID=2766526 RepID=UPI003919D0FF
MTDNPRISAAEAVLPGILKLRWTDGYEGIVDLRPIIKDGEIFDAIRDPERFSQVRIIEYGHGIFWLDDDGYEIDFRSGRLRELSERQAALLDLAG